MRFNPVIKYKLEELNFLLSKGEGAQLDFKQGITSQKKIARTIAAFANNRGGKLLIGVRDNGQLIGCDVEEEMFMVYEAAEHFCEPPIDIYFSVYETEEGLSVLEVEIKNSLRKPHFALDDQDDWQLYIRSNDKTMVATKNMQKILGSEDKRNSSSEKFDSKEQYVLDYLKQYEFITPKLLTQKLNISLQRANIMLVKLTQSGLLIYHKDGRGDHYSLR